MLAKVIYFIYITVYVLRESLLGAVFPVIVMGIILGLVVMLFIINNSSAATSAIDIPIPYSCKDSCRYYRTDNSDV